MICSADGDAVVLVFHRKLQRWLQTGGHLEADDRSLSGAAAREAAEESGLRLDAAPGGIVHLDAHPVPCGGNPAVHLDVRYVFLADRGQTPSVSEESEQVRWFAVDELPETDASVTDLVGAAAATLRG